MYRRMSVIVIMGLLFMGATASGMDKKEVDQLIEKMRKAVDPEDVSKEIKTQMNTIEIIIPAQQMKINAVVIDKFPDKTKTTTELPGIMNSVKIYNGKNGWEYSSATGLREITGEELEGMKFEMIMKNPALTMRDVFADIQISEKIEKIGEYDCFKLTCIPKKEYNSKPIIMYVDNKDSLLRKLEIVINSSMGPIKTESILSDYQKVNKMLVAMKSTITQLNMVMEAKIVEIKNNIEVDDSVFKKPEIPEAPTPTP